MHTRWRVNGMSTHSFPDRKISETLIDFAQPLVAMIDGHTTEEQVRQAFMIAVTVWNSHVLDEASDCCKYKAMLRECLGDGWASYPFLQALIERRQRYFATDMRAISNFRVRFLNGELRVWAEARDPYQTQSS
jgi:hypothetical protein